MFWFKDKKSTSNMTKWLCSASCLFPIFYAQQIFRIQFLTSGRFSDKRRFHASGFASTKNPCIWGTKSKREVQQHALHRENVTVWCVVHSNGMVGQYYFINKESEESIITQNWTFTRGFKLHNYHRILFFPAGWSPSLYFRERPSTSEWHISEFLYRKI